MFSPIRSARNAVAAAIRTLFLLGLGAVMHIAALPPAHAELLCDGRPIPPGKVCCSGGRHCEQGTMCIEGGMRCLPLSSPRACSNNQYCPQGSVCAPEGGCISASFDRYCGGRSFCKSGWYCVGDGKCRSYAADAEAAKTLREMAEQWREYERQQEQQRREEAQRQEEREARERAVREAEARQGSRASGNQSTSCSTITDRNHPSSGHCSDATQKLNAARAARNNSPREAVQHYRDAAEAFKRAGDALQAATALETARELERMARSSNTPRSTTETDRAPSSTAERDRTPVARSEPNLTPQVCKGLRYTETRWCASDTLQQSDVKDCIDNAIQTGDTNSRTGMKNYTFKLKLHCGATKYMVTVKTFDGNGECTRKVFPLSPTQKTWDMESSSRPEVLDAINVADSITEGCYIRRHDGGPCTCAPNEPNVGAQAQTKRVAEDLCGSPVDAALGVAGLRGPTFRETEKVQCIQVTNRCTYTIDFQARVSGTSGIPQQELVEPGKIGKICASNERQTLEYLGMKKR
jgi:hypothetical protein